MTKSNYILTAITGVLISFAITLIYSKHFFGIIENSTNTIFALVLPIGFLGIFSMNLVKAILKGRHMSLVIFPVLGSATAVAVTHMLSRT